MPTKLDLEDKLITINSKWDTDFRLDSWGSSKYRIVEYVDNGSIHTVSPVANSANEMWYYVKGLNEGLYLQKRMMRD